MIKAIVACVPKNKVKNSEIGYEKVIKLTGIDERRTVYGFQGTFSLGVAAAERLILESNVDRSKIKLLVFITQTPACLIPTNACMMQEKLRLPQEIVAFDVNLGCSGYIYGLYLMENLLRKGELGLLIVGDALSTAISAGDKATEPIFGDAAAATLYQKQENHLGIKSEFTFLCDGKFSNAITQKEGECLSMNGGEVFNLVQAHVPDLINLTLERHGFSQNDIDYFFLHQANASIVSYLCTKLKIDPKRVPITYNTFGNTSSASIPLTIAASLPLEDLKCKRKLLLAGFGSGASYGATIQSFEGLELTKVVEI